MGQGPSLCLSSLPSASLSPAPLSAGENLKRDPISLENIYSHFQPSLENVDPTTEATRGPIRTRSCAVRPTPATHHPGAPWGGWAPVV